MYVKIAHNRGLPLGFKSPFNSVKISIKKIKREIVFPFFFFFSPNSLNSSSLKRTGDTQISGKRGGLPQSCRHVFVNCDLFIPTCLTRRVFRSRPSSLLKLHFLPHRTPLPLPLFARDEDCGHVLLLREMQAGDKQCVKDQPSKKARHSLRILSVQRVETKLMLSSSTALRIGHLVHYARFSFNRVCIRVAHACVIFIFPFFYLFLYFFFFSFLSPSPVLFRPNTGFAFSSVYPGRATDARFLKHDSPTLYYTYWNDAYFQSLFLISLSSSRNW